MLQTLRISNIAVIEEVEVSFGEGLTVLTGETGAGKSILVDSLSLLLGGRADPDCVRAGCEEGSVEGVFLPSASLRARLEDLGLPAADDELCVRRVIGRGGRGKAYVNGALVTLNVLSRLMRGWVDIAGQHEHMSLFDPTVHRDLLDRVAGLEVLREAYGEAYTSLRALEAERASLGGSEQQIRERTDFLRYQLSELDALDPKPEEDRTLEDDRRRLANIQKLQRAAAEAEGALRGQEASALDGLGRAMGALAEASKLDAALEAPLAQLRVAQAELEGAARTLGRYAEAAEADPARLAELDERLDALRKLCRKHSTDLPGLVERRSELGVELERWENCHQVRERLDMECRAAKEHARLQAQQLSQARVAAGEQFSRLVREALVELAMGRCEFRVEVRAEGDLGPCGADQVEFFFGANAGEPARPLAKVASGGEASRVLLALKRVLAEVDGCGCYVLDEADAGVGGAVADVVGRMMREVSGERQVLCITHLPQVAAYADAHLLIRKELRHGRTVSTVRPLASPEQRTSELARMLSGVEVSPEALGAAEALVRSAQRPRRPVRPARPGLTRARRSA